MLCANYPLTHSRCAKRTVSWDDLLTLSTLIRAGSYSACARELDITHATAIRRIRRLEEALGKPVATRSEGAFELTSAGRSALTAARQMEQSAGRLMREIEGTGSGVSGVVRIAATAALGSHFLTPRLLGLYAAHPDIVVRLELDDRVASLARRHAHLAVRLARPKEDDIVAQRVGTVPFGLYGSAAVPMDDSTPLCALLDEGYDIPEATWPQARSDVSPFRPTICWPSAKPCGRALELRCFRTMSPATMPDCGSCARYPRSCARSGWPTRPSFAARRASGR